MISTNNYHVTRNPASFLTFEFGVNIIFNVFGRSEFASVFGQNSFSVSLTLELFYKPSLNNEHTKISAVCHHEMVQCVKVDCDIRNKKEKQTKLNHN